MVRRLLIAGRLCVVVHNRQRAAVERLRQAGAAGSAFLQEMGAPLARLRVVRLMVPAAGIDGLLVELAPLLQAGDTVVDGGNTNYRDDIPHAAELQTRGIHHVDVGTSGSVAGL